MYGEMTVYDIHNKQYKQAHNHTPTIDTYHIGFEVVGTDADNSHIGGQPCKIVVIVDAPHQTVGGLSCAGGMWMRWDGT